MRPQHRLRHLLKAAGLSRSVFYYHRKGLMEPDRDAEWGERLGELYQRHEGRYGYRRLHLALRALGWRVNPKKVLRLMRALGLKGIVAGRKRYVAYRGEGHRKVANVLRRDFRAGRPGEKLVTDITEMKVAGEKLYLSPLLDLHGNEVISFTLGTRPDLALVTGMFTASVRERLCKTEGGVLHTDQGWHYQHAGYHRLLEQMGLRPSMSRKGNCYDNAVVESFFGTLKRELYRRREWPSVAELAEAIKGYIRYYNEERIMLRLKMSPVQYRRQFGSA